jgi:ribosome-binding factor A
MNKKISQINQLIKKELGQIIHQNLDLPNGILATVTRVETSRNLFQARVFISCIPESPQAISILNKKIYSIQKKLNERMEMKIVPRIEFIEEKKTKEAARIEELLEKVRKKENESRF